MSEESKLIRSFVESWGDMSSGIGDDAAILDVPGGEKLVVSTDSSVENVHFRRVDVSAAEIGYRGAAAALSDLAAMGSRPLGLLFALVLPVGWRGDAADIALGVGEAAKAFGCAIIGGNISAGEELSITTTVLGSSANPLLRSGARAGDSVYVTGTLGGAAAAVAAWSAGRIPTPETRKRFVAPVARIPESLWLASHGATSAIDISDGLTTDAMHVAQASGVSLGIDVDCVPFAPGVSIEQALSGGEDYELLVTAPALDVGEFQQRFHLPLTCIGAVTAGDARVELRKGGKPFAAAAGFDHLEVE